jgi:hypothetical protein
MNQFCQIEFVSSDSDIRTPCGKLAVSRHPQFDSSVLSASEVENDSNEHN